MNRDFANKASYTGPPLLDADFPPNSSDLCKILGYPSPKIARYLSVVYSTRTHRPMEWKSDRCVISRTLRPIVPFYRSFCALSLARSAQAERDNESSFFVRAAGVHRFIRRYHVK
ncbi:hypothetical protein EVAR_40604_1 [Eumeta japonica]|uniref:Uncharacterized protein n=1 Tax=Eumeta variegata TaxID=151549 RepID=A0A4C1XI36_EUMVA|nr:hypothetical protein EVAR_40604_1 [Eumeta japonica]